MTSSDEEQHRINVFAEMDKHKAIQDSVKNANDGEEATVDIDVFKDMLTRRNI
ncbi:hypothetical protein N9D51_02215 [Actinomycetota bacterium]|nr:hypothetical protein [Actinomycetota bacterium]